MKRGRKGPGIKKREGSPRIYRRTKNKRAGIISRKATHLKGKMLSAGKSISASHQKKEGGSQKRQPPQYAEEAIGAKCRGP